MTTSARRLLALALLVAVPLATTGCAARRPATLPDLSPDAPEGLKEPHGATAAAYEQCAESYNQSRIPWQGPVALATGALAVLGLVGATATPLIANGVLPPHLSGPVGAIGVGVLGLAAGVSAGATAYLAAQVPQQIEQTEVKGRLLQVLEGRALEATAAGDIEGLDRLSREIYEDCRVAQATADATSAEIVIRDLQRYRQEAQDASSRAGELGAAQEQLTQQNAALTTELEEKRAEIKRWEAKTAAVEERIALLEENVSQKQAENASLRSEVSRMELEQASLSADKMKLLEEKRKLEEKTSHYEQLAEALKSEVKDGKVALRRLRNGVVVEMQNKVLFPSGTAELNEQGLETLAKVAEAIKGLKDRRIRIEGHTDNIPLGKKGEFASNWELSSARAIAVTKYLQDLGVNPAQMSAEGRSQYAPVASNRTAAGRAKNRRIEIYLVPEPVGEAAKFSGEGE